MKGEVRDMGRFKGRCKVVYVYSIRKAANLTQSEISAMWERLNRVEATLENKA